MKKEKITAPLRKQEELIRINHPRVIDQEISEKERGAMLKEYGAARRETEYEISRMIHLCVRQAEKALASADAETLRERKCRGCHQASMIFPLEEGLCPVCSNKPAIFRAGHSDSASG